MLSPYNCIMLIDDSPADNLIAEILIRNAGLSKEIITCRSVRDALDYLAACGGKGPLNGSVWPGLILLDLYLPVHDGFEFLARLTQLSLPFQPVVYIVTASLREEDRERAKAYSCVKGFLVKPLTEEAIKQLRK